MKNLQTYRNIRAQEILLPGVIDALPAIRVDAALAAAAERKQARKVEPGEVLLGSNGKPIPEGWYVIYTDEGHLETIVASEPTFFESIWELDTPRS
jgi:hypothetical protein